MQASPQWPSSSPNRYLMLRSRLSLFRTKACDRGRTTLQVPLRHDATLRFRRRKSRAGRRAHSLVNESLEAAAVEVFADVDVTFAVDREGMRHVQRSAEDPLLSDVIDDLERLTQKNPDVVVRAVDHIQEALIWREREPGCRAAEQRSRRHEPFPYKRAVCLENLDAVVGPVGDIHEAILRQRNIVRQTELLH